MNVTIQLSDEQAAALQAKAAAEGLSLDKWFERLAVRETHDSQPSSAIARMRPSCPC
jgi:hypothetical protein